MLSISVQKSLHFAFGKKDLQVELTVPSGQLVAIVGTSGSGKTTLLRLLAGLSTVDKGRISFEREVWTDTQKRIQVSPQQRAVGFVFQDYALFPNMTVRQNLAFALSKGQSDGIIAELLDITALTTLADRYPAMLSGGQQQRAALARAVVRQPKLLLLDEPLAALDTELRSRLQQFIRTIHQRFSLTTILVSHDRTEILRLADRVVQLEQGEIVQEANPATFFQLEPTETARLTGEILRVIGQQDKRQAEVLIGENILKIPLSPTQQVQPGSQVQVRFSQKGQWEIVLL